MRVEPHRTPDELAALARLAAGGRVARRLLAERLALLGQAAEAVGPQVPPSGRQVKTWVHRYNACGVAARRRAGPTPADGVCSLRGQDVRRVLREEFGVVRCL